MIKEADQRNDLHRDAGRCNLASVGIQGVLADDLALRMQWEADDLAATDVLAIRMQWRKDEVEEETGWI